MAKMDYSKLSNAEIKQKLIVLENEFQRYKNDIKEKCEKLAEIEAEYETANNEIRLRKSIY